MKKIDNYIDSLYKDMDESSDEVQVLKQEMKNHLLQTVNDLKAEGKNEEESVEIAIRRFGESGQIEMELSKVFKIQNRFAKVLLKFAIIFFALFLTAYLSSVILYKINYKISVGPSAAFNASIQSKLIGIESKLQSNGTIAKEDISNLFKQCSNHVKYIAVIPDSSGQNLLSDDINNGFVYPTGISKNYLMNDLTIGSSQSIEIANSKWSIAYGVYGFGSTSPIIYYIPLIKTISLLCFTGYWLFFGLWGVINAYNSNRFSISWIILFFTLNILALLFFKFDETQWFKRLKAQKI